MEQTTIGGVTAVYGYNASGVRHARWDGNSFRSYALDGNSVVLEANDGSIVDKYVYGVNLVSKDSSSYYLHNGHGDVTYLTDDDGAITKTYEYDAFGNEENPVSTDTNPFRYAGEYYDKETGTYYLRARYYDPVIGRFTQEDPHWNQSNMLYGDDPLKLNNYTYAPSLAAIIQSGNLYVYAMSNPTRYTDPDGEFAIPAWLVAAGTKVLSSTVVDSFKSGVAYWLKGEPVLAGITTGAITGFGSGVGSLGGPIGEAAGSAIGAGIGALAEEYFFYNRKLDSSMIQPVAEAVAKDILGNIPEAYWQEALDIAKETGSAASVLMEYSPEFGEYIKEFFDILVRTLD